MKKSTLNILILVILVIGASLNLWFIPYLQHENILAQNYLYILDNIFVIPMGCLLIWRFLKDSLSYKNKTILLSFLIFTIPEALFYNNHVDFVYNIIGYIIGAIITYLISMVLKKNGI